jgi:hypothetical protein
VDTIFVIFYGDCWTNLHGLLANSGRNFYIYERDLRNTRGLYGRPLFFWLFLLASLKYRAKSIQSFFFFNSVVYRKRKLLVSCGAFTHKPQLRLFRNSLKNLIIYICSGRISAQSYLLFIVTNCPGDDYFIWPKYFDRPHKLCETCLFS